MLAAELEAAGDGDGDMGRAEAKVDIVIYVDDECTAAAKPVTDAALTSMRAHAEQETRKADAVRLEVEHAREDERGRNTEEAPLRSFGKEEVASIKSTEHADPAQMQKTEPQLLRARPPLRRQLLTHNIAAATAVVFTAVVAGRRL